MRRNLYGVVLVVLGVWLGAGWHAGVTAQARQAPSGQDVLPALLAEVRGLRAAMEQMASAGTRVQLALGRLQLQEQRVNNLLRRMESLRAQLAGTQQNEERIRQDAARMEEFLKRADSQDRPDDRRAAERQLRDLKDDHARVAADVQRLQVEESGVTQELTMEQGRWSEINQRMEELERTLTRK